MTRYGLKDRSHAKKSGKGITPKRKATRLEMQASNVKRDETLPPYESSEAANGY